jgi:hypothetical protein
MDAKRSETSERGKWVKKHLCKEILGEEAKCWRIGFAQQACIMRLEEPDAMKVTSGRLEKGAYEI